MCRKFFSAPRAVQKHYHVLALVNMSAKAGKRPLRSLTAQEKLDAIRRVHDGESKASVARDIGVPESTLRGWCKNEDKISYLSRQSSPESVDSVNGEPKEKKQKVEDILQPYNLSMKAASSYVTPNRNVHYPTNFDVCKPDQADKSKIAADLSMKADTPKPSNHMSERERNRAELARISVELGLNRPEVFLPASTATTSANTDATSNFGLLWNNMVMQQQLLPNTANSSGKKITAPADTSTNLVSSSGLLTTINKLEEQKQQATARHQPKPPRADRPPALTFDDSMIYWQAMLMAHNSLTNQQLPPVSASTTNGNSAFTGVPANGTTDHSSWFWRIYKTVHDYYGSFMPDKPILYQQLTKNKDGSNCENLNGDTPPPPKNGSKSRVVLDNLLINNVNDPKDMELMSEIEALDNGEKMLKWLDSCSIPSITTVQIMQFRTLLNNIRSDIDRKTGDSQNKIKMRRK